MKTIFLNAVASKFKFERVFRFRMLHLLDAPLLYTQLKLKNFWNEFYLCIYSAFMCVIGL